jgi:hypothetical protein
VITYLNCVSVEVPGRGIGRGFQYFCMLLFLKSNALAEVSLTAHRHFLWLSDQITMIAMVNLVAVEFLYFKYLWATYVAMYSESNYTS